LIGYNGQSQFNTSPHRRDELKGQGDSLNTTFRGAITVLGLAIAMSVIGCGPKLSDAYRGSDTVPAGKGIVYIYRQSDATHPTYVPAPALISKGDKVLVMMPPGSYLPLVAELGELELKTQNDSVTLDIKPGQIHFVRVTSKGIGQMARFHITPVDRVEADEDLKDTQLVETREDWCKRWMCFGQ
jgi:hypothetical protein